MKKLIAAYRVNAAKRALYRRTRDEIASMPRDVALDLGIFPEDADRIAREAVWGYGPDPRHDPGAPGPPFDFRFCFKPLAKRAALAR